MNWHACEQVREAYKQVKDENSTLLYRSYLPMTLYFKYWAELISQDSSFTSSNGLAECNVLMFLMLWLWL